MPAFVTFGRVLFAVLFMYTGATKLMTIPATADMIATKVIIPAAITSQLTPYTTQLASAAGMPIAQIGAIVIGVFEVIAGLMIALNFLPRLFSVLMILFVAAATYYFHDFWNQPSPDNARALIDALKNLSIIGALFMIFGYGRGSRQRDMAYGDV